MIRIILLSTVLFLAGFSSVSAQQDMEGVVVIPKSAMVQFFVDVQELQKSNRSLAEELIRAQDVIKFGMGCT